MTEEERAALAALRFSWAQAADDVWRPSPFHVDGLHPAVVRDVLDSLAEAGFSPDANPIGLVLEGRHGSGKTHLLGWVREQVQQQGGYFFLIGLLDGRTFWDGVLIFLLSGLTRTVPGSESQLRLLLRRLSSKIGAPRPARRAVMGDKELTREALDAFAEGLSAYDSFVAHECRDTLRALALRASDDEDQQDVADSYFDGEPITDALRAWGIRRRHKPQDVVREISWLLALTGPSVIAFDQIDTAIAQMAVREDLALEAQKAEPLINIAAGLSDLREVTRRTVTVVATLTSTWEQIEDKATASFPDRFRRCPSLQGIRTVEIARLILEKRFASRYADIGFTPPYPTWPVRPGALIEAINYTPRRLLVVIDRHVRACLIAGEVRELVRLEDASVETREVAPSITAPVVPDEALARIEARYEQLKRDADVTSPLEHDTEDSAFPELLSAGLHAWIVERGDRGAAFSVDPPPSSRPDLHARLRRELDERTEEERENSPDQTRTEDQMHWSFRAISDTHHGNAVLSRMRRARTAAGLSPGVDKRKLFLIRNAGYSSSARTQEILGEVRRDGGMTLSIEDEDLRILTALRDLREENPNELHAWLVKYRPTEQLSLFKEALAEAVEGEQVTPRREDGAGFTAGMSGDQNSVPLSLEALRKHAAIFAASGSGKTVLIRRLIEECALLGVSAIVLDPNNDLARLGDEWPYPPDKWAVSDLERARDYHAGTEVVVWTPRREAGRPLSFQPLPDFAAVLDDPDEFGEAVDSAVAALAPRANLIGRTMRAQAGAAVLRKAVEHYGRRGGGSMRGLIDVLADFPDGVSQLRDAGKLASDVAQALTAAMDNDPLFGGTGAPADPGTLLTPSPGRNARISVISMMGLRSNKARQSFVNQLQMSLFAWIKKNPARERPLLGLLVMDEAQDFAPSGAMTACTQSTLALASQARKYGLGLLFATQAPKNLHNRIPGNAATHFFGRLTVPAQVEAAREMAKAKGGDVPDVGALTSGEFYIALEGSAPEKIRTPMCLSYHPSSPLTDEEVLARALR
ncbi:DUF87 domain-containing protein [Actinoplanes sp. TRM 88003]|uniref:DUF87 domain-containing protein n=1 Tax=Paractinoplanes aksuensis TaxID=2939490 RepID=A0ABT1DLS2_9ACTN|nr:DUF87 domain-containing protein [Actinoplanes aksuensis]MCO8271794.1 DUF87 domain-containing protein [Actinoplanes aksuensis]